MSSQTLYKNDFLHVEFFTHDKSISRGIAIVFTPSLNRYLDGNRYGGEVFLRNGFDTIAFKNAKDDWFQSVPLIVFSQINELCISKGYTKRIAYGSSMGGFASLAFSKMLNLDAAIIFSPQISICESFDTRWDSYSKLINFVYHINENTINKSCKFHIFYDDKNLDRVHIEKLISVIPQQNCNLVAISFSGHPVSHYLSEVSLIKDLIVYFINKDSFDGIDFLKMRRSSKTYFQTLALFFLKNGKLKSALSMIDLAIKIDDKKSNFHHIRSLILEHLGRFDEALGSINKAISIDELNESYLIQRSKILNVKGFNDVEDK